jgi:hypothetical protein
VQQTPLTHMMMLFAFLGLTRQELRFMKTSLVITLNTAPARKSAKALADQKST